MKNKPCKGSIEQLARSSATKIATLKTKNVGRRLMDNNPNLSVEMDRRVKNAERRDLDTMSHDSPVRRYTIDRRVRVKDRRSSTNITT